jgi:hypothetical protein
VKLFVSDQTFVNIGYRYEWFFNSFEAAGITEPTLITW